MIHSKSAHFLIEQVLISNETFNKFRDMKFRDLDDTCMHTILVTIRVLTSKYTLISCILQY